MHPVLGLVEHDALGAFEYLVGHLHGVAAKALTHLLAHGGLVVVVGTLSVVIYLALGAIGIPVFSGYGAGLAKLAGPTGGYLVGYLLLAFIGGMFIEKSKGNPVVSAVGLVLGDAACYVLGTAWFVFQMQCELGYALTVCVYPFIALDLAKIVVSCIVGALLRKRLTQAGVLKLQNAVSE